MKNIFAALLLLASFASAQETDSAQHPFWDRQQVTAQSLQAAFHVADAVQTCYHLHEGWVERTSPFQSCSGNVAWMAGATGTSVGISYLLHRTGHHKLERLTPYMFATSSTVAIGYSFWPRKQHPCQPNWPCER